MNRFYALRVERGLTQEQVADGAGLSRATVIGLETRRDPRPHGTTVTKLADFYDLTVEQLLGLEHTEAA